MSLWGVRNSEFGVRKYYVAVSLLKNLCEYQAIWHCWKPDKYHPVEIEAEIEQEESFSGARKGAIATFSGGVDSCFTMYRHKRGLCGRGTENIEAGIKFKNS